MSLGRVIVIYWVRCSAGIGGVDGGESIDDAADGTDEIQVDNGTPCETLVTKGIGCISELKLCPRSR